MIRIGTIVMVCFSTLTAHAETPSAQKEIFCATPMVDWQPVAKLMAVAEGMGWTVQRIRVDEGCYQLRGTDQMGKFIEAVFDPQTLALLGTSGGDDETRHKKKGDHS